MTTCECKCNLDRVKDGENGDVPKIVDDKMALLITTGAAMAANCEPCLNKIIPDLKSSGATDSEIRMAVEVGQMVKDKPAIRMKKVADMLTGSTLSENNAPHACRLETMKPGEEKNRFMLIAAGAAMAANCEPCLNQLIPNLIEDGVSDSDIRRAVLLGQYVKEKPADHMKEVADVLTGSKLTAGASNPESAGSESPCCGQSNSDRLAKAG